MLTPEELTALQDLDSDLKIGEPEIRLSPAMSQNAHSAIAKLLKREGLERVAKPEPEPKGRFAIPPNAAAGAVRVAIKSLEPFDHSKRTSKYFQNQLGYCICDDCRKLPECDPQRIVRSSEDRRPPETDPYLRAFIAMPGLEDRLRGVVPMAAVDTEHAVRSVMHTIGRFLPTPPRHEVELTRQVLAQVREHEFDSDGFTRFGESTQKRRPHDVVVSDAVACTLDALGYVIKLDGTIAVKPTTTGQDNETDKQG